MKIKFGSSWFCCILFASICKAPRLGNLALRLTFLESILQTSNKRCWRKHRETTEVGSCLKLMIPGSLILLRKAFVIVRASCSPLLQSKSNENKPITEPHSNKPYQTIFIIVMFSFKSSHSNPPIYQQMATLFQIMGEAAHIRGQLRPAATPLIWLGL